MKCRTYKTYFVKYCQTKWQGCTQFGSIGCRVSKADGKWVYRQKRERSFKVLILVLRICEDILEYLIYMFDIAGGRIKKFRIIGREISDGKLKLPSQLLVQIHPKFLASSTISERHFLFLALKGSLVNLQAITRAGPEGVTIE